MKSWIKISNHIFIHLFIFIIWFGFKYEVIYFYNVYGPKLFSKGEMATVIGIFETQYKKRLPLARTPDGTTKYDFVFDLMFSMHESRNLMWQTQRNKTITC